MIVFMSAPIVAPFIGQMMLKVMTWHGIFWALSGFGALMFLWVLLRLPETLPLGRRVPLNIPTMFRNYGKVIRTREALGYTIASGFLFGGLMSYISASEQLYHEVYDTYFRHQSPNYRPEPTTTAAPTGVAPRTAVPGTPPGR